MSHIYDIKLKFNGIYMITLNVVISFASWIVESLKVEDTVLVWKHRKMLLGNWRIETGKKLPITTAREAVLVETEPNPQKRRRWLERKPTLNKLKQPQSQRPCMWENKNQTLPTEAEDDLTPKKPQTHHEEKQNTRRRRNPLGM
jgi:hypothetical protein